MLLKKIPVCVQRAGRSEARLRREFLLTRHIGASRLLEPRDQVRLVLAVPFALAPGEEQVAPSAEEEIGPNLQIPRENRPVISPTGDMGYEGGRAASQTVSAR
jgi:hypothetical protein